VALKDWIDEADKAYGEPLFTSLKGNKGSRLSVGHYAKPPAPSSEWQKI